MFPSGGKAPVISGYITTFISIWFSDICMPISSKSPFIFIIPFIIFMPSKYFSLSIGAISCLIPSPKYIEVDLVRSSEVAKNSYAVLSAGIVTTTSYVSETAISNRSTSTGSTSFPSLATTVIFPPAYRNQK